MKEKRKGPHGGFSWIVKMRKHLSFGVVGVWGEGSKKKKPATAAKPHHSWFLSPGIDQKPNILVSGQFKKIDRRKQMLKRSKKTPKNTKLALFSNIK